MDQYWMKQLSLSRSHSRRLRLGGAVPLDRAGRPRPAAGSGGRGLRAGEGARPTRLRRRHLAESRGYPLLDEIGADRLGLPKYESRGHSGFWTSTSSTGPLFQTVRREYTKRDRGV